MVETIASLLRKSDNGVVVGSIFKQFFFFFSPQQVLLVAVNKKIKMIKKMRQLARACNKHLRCSHPYPEQLRYRTCCSS